MCEAVSLRDDGNVDSTPNASDAYYPVLHDDSGSNEKDGEINTVLKGQERERDFYLKPFLQMLAQLISFLIVQAEEDFSKLRQIAIKASHESIGVFLLAAPNKPKLPWPGMPLIGRRS
jgi:hypothetical protein